MKNDAVVRVAYAHAAWTRSHRLLRPGFILTGSTVGAWKVLTFVGGRQPLWTAAMGSAVAFLVYRFLLCPRLPKTEWWPIVYFNLTRNVPILMLLVALGVRRWSGVVVPHDNHDAAAQTLTFLQWITSYFLMHAATLIALDRMVGFVDDSCSHCSNPLIISPLLWDRVRQRLVALVRPTFLPQKSALVQRLEWEISRHRHRFITQIVVRLAVAGLAATVLFSHDDATWNAAWMYAVALMAPLFLQEQHCSLPTPWQVFVVRPLPACVLYTVGATILFLVTPTGGISVSRRLWYMFLPTSFRAITAITVSSVLETAVMARWSHDCVTYLPGLLYHHFVAATPSPPPPRIVVDRLLIDTIMYNDFDGSNREVDCLLVGWLRRRVLRYLAHAHCMLEPLRRSLVQALCRRLCAWVTEAREWEHWQQSINNSSMNAQRVGSQPAPEVKWAIRALLNVLLLQEDRPSPDLVSATVETLEMVHPYAKAECEEAAKRILPVAALPNVGWIRGLVPST